MDDAAKADDLVVVFDDGPGEASAVRHPDHDELAVMPARISRFCVITGQVLLLNSILSFIIGLPWLGAVLFATWTTTMGHWSKPLYATYVRRIDVAVVQVLVWTCTYFIVTLCPFSWAILWYVGMGIGAAVFLVNEHMFFRDVAGTALGSDGREWCYVRTVLVHGLFVHLLPNICACIAFIGGYKGGELFRR
jgi:hypothetical protein